MYRVTRWTCLAAALVCAGCGPRVSPEGERLLRAAETAYSRNDDDATVQRANEFLRLHPSIPESAEALYLRGLARLRQGQPAAGRQDLRAALNLAERDDLIALIHSKLGDLSYQNGDLLTAQRHYSAVLQKAPAGAPPSDQAMYRLGVIHQRRGEWREADLHFDKLMYLFEDTELGRRAQRRAHARRWSIQVSALTRPGPAAKMLQQFRRQGFEVRVDRELAAQGDEMMHLVRVGSYATYGAAQADLSRIRQIRPDAFITPAR